MEDAKALHQQQQQQQHQQQQQILLQQQHQQHQQQQQHFMLLQQLQKQQQQQQQQAGAISRFPSNIDAHLRPMRPLNLQQNPNPNPNTNNPILNLHQNPNSNNLQQQQSQPLQQQQQQQQQKAIRPGNQMELQMAYQDAWRVCHPDFKRPFSSLEDACERLNGADIDFPEWMFSKMMRSAKIKFNDYSITRVIIILGNLGNWRRVIQIIEWLQRRERFKSHKLRHIYTAALYALRKSRRSVEALNVFHAMQQQMSTYPDLVAYYSVAVTLGQAGYMKELFDVIDIMRSPPKKNFKTGAFEKWEWDPRLEPDIVVYDAVLNACAKRKQWEGAFWVLQQLKKQGQQPSATTYGLVMENPVDQAHHHLASDLHLG